MTTTWKIPRETREWVGPLTPFATDAGTGLPVPINPSAVKFAVLKLDNRPVTGDWSDPVVDPEGGSAIGVQAVPIDHYERQGIWARITDGAEVIVLEPGDVGYITRT